MKTLLVLSLIAVSAILKDPQATLTTNQGLEIQPGAEIDFQEKVRIYDYQGNLMKEYLLSEVVNNEISVSDHFIIEESDFAFDYLGDYYYFTEEILAIGVN